MKNKFLPVFLLIIAAFAGQALAQTEMRPLLPAYWIFGTIADTQEAASAVTSTPTTPTPTTTTLAGGPLGIGAPGGETGGGIGGAAAAPTIIAEPREEAAPTVAAAPAPTTTTPAPAPTTGTPLGLTGGGEERGAAGISALSVGASQTVPVGTRRVFFYNDKTDLDAGNYAVGTVKNNFFYLNAFTIFPAPLLIGQQYQIATEIDELGYGANGTITITGQGWEEVKGMTLARGSGILAPGTEKQPEPAPEIKIWFGNRLYQKKLVAGGQPFVVSSRPEMKLEFSIPYPYSISQNVGDHSIVLDAGTAASKTLALTTANVSAQAVNSLNLKYAFTDPLSEGTHTFTVAARSSGTVGSAAVGAETATVEVMGGPLRLVGVPIVFPSPFSITKHKSVTIQYGLSADADIDIYLTDIGGAQIKKFSFNARAEGGSAGINKVTWNGVTDFGYLAGNAIYVGTIIGREERRALGRVKITLLD